MSGQSLPVQYRYFLYVGTYTAQKSKGIYVYRFDASRANFDPIRLAAEVANPTFLALHPNLRFLYAVSELAGKSDSFVNAFSIDPNTGVLALINRVTTRGTDACHLVVDRTGKTLVAANYTSGSVAAFLVNSDGSLTAATSFIQHQGSSIHGQRQTGPHAHATVLSPDNRFVLVADLGLDRVCVYKLDPEKGKIMASDPPHCTARPGAGPRHLAFHPNGKFVYLLNELDSTVDTFAYDAPNGSLRGIQNISALRNGFSGESTAAEIEVHPSGQFLYASNRGSDTIAVFEIRSDGGTIAKIQDVSTQGQTPRNFKIDPTGAYLLVGNQDSNNIVVFQIDRKSGLLTATGEVLEVPSPACIEFVPMPA